MSAAPIPTLDVLCPNEKRPQQTTYRHSAPISISFLLSRKLIYHSKLDYIALVFQLRDTINLTRKNGMGIIKCPLGLMCGFT